MKGSCIVAVMLAAVISACGGSSDVTTPTTGGQGADPPGTGITKVSIQDFSYAPAAVTIKVGSTVQWINKGPSSHTSVSDVGMWNSGTLSAPGFSNDPYGGNS